MIAAHYFPPPSLNYICLVPRLFGSSSLVQIPPPYICDLSTVLLKLLKSQSRCSMSQPNTFFLPEAEQQIAAASSEGVQNLRPAKLFRLPKQKIPQASLPLPGNKK